MLRHLREVIALDPGWYSGMYDVNPITGLCTSFLGFVPWLTSTEWYLEITSTAGHAAGSGNWDAKVDETMNREIAKFLITIK